MRDWMRMFRQSIPVMMTAGMVWAGMLCEMRADDAAAEISRRNAAVALNYSRASFHRIRRYPSMRVLMEEQEKILNHLNLNGIADEEVVKLYTASLDEIAQIQLGDRERELLKEKYRRQFNRDFTINALSLGASVATAQFGAAVKTGATSWWDYRNQSQNRELDAWKIEKDRMTRLTNKSAQFLDVSWKMARNKQIPDRWLVRGDDLDKLEDAWREPDPAVRLRVLKRMEPFLETYPPYWYYVARTQQSMGQLFASSETYEKLAKLGDGHFRKDDMLAAGMANRALIQAYLSQPGAAESAKQALNYSTDVWEANLLCAMVLQGERQYDVAEDAILRNLDVSLERSQSQQALIGLYLASNDTTKLSMRLSDPAVARELPAPQLLACVAKLGEVRTPPAVAMSLQRSLQIAPRFNLGRDDLVVQSTPSWNLQQARLTLTCGDKTYDSPQWSMHGTHLQATFEGVGEFSSTLGSGEQKDVLLTVEYAHSPPIKLSLQWSGPEATTPEASNPLAAVNRRYPVFKVAGLEHDQQRLSFHQGTLKTLPAPAVAPGGETLSQTLPAGRSTLKPVDPDPFLITPPIDIPIVPPM
ncbi:MAG TPA: hypothetical protein VFG20_23550 [Planctomycetaceae bacterium]|nr:hypothetical protein [Planctomycetaceae bacterium]